MNRRTIKLYCDWRALCGLISLAMMGAWHHGFSGVESEHRPNSAEKFAHIAEFGAEGKREGRRDGVECEIDISDDESTMICWELSTKKPKPN